MNALLSGSGSVPSASWRVLHGRSGFMLPLMPKRRMLVYLPERILSRETLRDMVWTNGKAMLLWPPQYQTSPNVTRLMTAGVLFVHPEHVAVTSKFPPAGCGSRQAFQSPPSDTVAATRCTELEIVTVAPVPPVPRSPYTQLLAGACWSTYRDKSEVFTCD